MYGGEDSIRRRRNEKRKDDDVVTGEEEEEVLSCEGGDKLLDLPFKGNDYDLTAN